MRRVGLSIVVPCLNESESLRELHRRLAAVAHAANDSFEIVLVDDGSTDATWAIMKLLAGEDSNVRAVKLSRNFGHQLALSSGLSICAGDRILIIDADLQDPPELLPQMMQLMDEGADVVYGQRRVRSGETLFKRMSASIFYSVIDRLSETPIPRETGDFRLISRRVLNILLDMPEKHRFIRGLISWIGFKQVPLLYDRQARFAGKTKYPFKKMIRFAADALTAFSVKPLQLASLIGLFFAGVGVLLAVFAVVSFLFFQVISGWASTMAGVSIMGSVQLFVLGIIGEYLGRMYEQSKGRPLFIIETIAAGRLESEVAPQQTAAIASASSLNAS